jgi:hypothetical protein
MTNIISQIPHLIEENLRNDVGLNRLKKFLNPIKPNTIKIHPKSMLPTFTVLF